MSTVDLDRLVHPDEARRIVLSHARRLTTEHVALDEAAGRILSEDVVAAEDHPPFAAATMDGYAVVADDASPWREVLGEQFAGQMLDLEVSDGAVVRIMTGAPVPRGADAVVRVEATEPAEDHVVILQEQVAPGENIRAVGSDLRQGDLVLAAGTELGPAELGLVAGVGLVPVPVSARPRVSVVSTGDELVEPGEPLRPGQIRDSNRFSLVAALVGAGATVVWSGKAPDSERALRTLLEQRLGESDVVVTSGGVSMGDLDLVKPLLEDLATVHFRRIFMKPGKPLNFATTAAGAVVFGLPGNPVSALVSFETFIRPALRSMMGCSTIDRPRVRVSLGEETWPSDRIEMQRVTVRVDGEGKLVATSTGSQASSRLASFLGANALLVVPPREEPYRSGERLDAILLGLPIEGDVR
ncbi:MAG TPA: gephyrin-like molybdotransferase Glp, partial [Thermomicrobiales bacterium]|nr:gephyrin-like molybdotransferase Glp [Thermomicrobiales bacterium]